MKIESIVESYASPYVQFNLNSVYIDSQVSAQQLFCSITSLLDIIADDSKSFCSINAQIINLKTDGYSVSIHARIRPPIGSDSDQWHKLVEQSINRRSTAAEECRDITPEIATQCKITYYGPKSAHVPSECPKKKPCHVKKPTMDPATRFALDRTRAHRESEKSWSDPDDSEIDWHQEELERYGVGFDD